MTLEQLRIFIEVAECEHVTRAASILNLTQSSVSGAIRTLERNHNVELFVRSGRGIRLSTAGRRFLREAKNVLQRAQAAQDVLTELGGTMNGTISIWASQTVASYWLPQRLVAFASRYPHVDLRVTIGNTEHVAEAVEDGHAEIGLVEGHLNNENQNLRRTVVAKDRMVVVVSAQHPWTREAPLSPDQLYETRWLLREEGSGTRSTLEDALAERGLDPLRLSVMIELPSNEAIRTALVSSLCAAALSHSVVEDAVNSGQLKIVNIALPERSFTLIRNNSRAESHLARTLRSELGRQLIVPQ